MTKDPVKHRFRIPGQSLLFLALLMYGNSLLCAALPRNNPVPGGVAVVALGSTADRKPSVFFGRHQVSVLAEDGIWYALVGLPLTATPGKHILSVSSKDHGTNQRIFKIHPLAAYQHQRTVNLPPDLKELSLDIAGTMQQALADEGLPDTDNDDITIFYPVMQQIVAQGRYLPYGHVLSAAETPIPMMHPFVTYLTLPEEIIRSPGHGYVSGIFRHLDTGTTVVLDHGGGLTSVITHLQETVLKPGEAIEAGEVIGIAASISGLQRGRVDWFIMLTGHFIDPLQLAPSS